MQVTSQTVGEANLTATNLSLCSGINTMLQDEQLCDIVLKAQETSICAHKVVLAAQSAYFKAMFEASM